MQAAHRSNKNKLSTSRDPHEVTTNTRGQSMVHCRKSASCHNQTYCLPTRTLDKPVKLQQISKKNIKETGCPFYHFTCYVPKNQQNLAVTVWLSTSAWQVRHAVHAHPDLSRKLGQGTGALWEPQRTLSKPFCKERQIHVQICRKPRFLGFQEILA